jgi:hypothetical protein
MALDYQIFDINTNSVYEISEIKFEILSKIW